MDRESASGAMVGRIGADRMALGLRSIPDPLHGDMETVKALRAEVARLSGLIEKAQWPVSGELDPTCLPNEVYSGLRKEIDAIRAEVEEKDKALAIAIDEVETVNKQLKAARADNDAYADMLRKERAEVARLQVAEGEAMLVVESQDASIARLQAELEKFTGPLTDEREAYHDKALLRDALHHWGLPSQLAMVAEEAAELAVAAMHMLRDQHDNKSGATDAFCSEMADVEIMIDQMKVAGYADKIAEFKASKMLRLGVRLDAAIREVRGK